MKKKIAVIGGSYLQLPAVKKAQELGYEVHCFAWKDGAVCAEVADYFYPISITEKEAILEECRRIGIDGITSIASDLAVIAVNYVAEKMGLPGNGTLLCGAMTNKYMMRRQLESLAEKRELSFQHSPFSPRFKKIKKTDSLEGLGFEFPVIVKPTDRSGSRGVTKVCCETDLASAVERACNESFMKEAIIEEYVDGWEVSVESISYNGRHYVLQITDKVTTGAPYFVEIAHHQPSSLPISVKEQISLLVPAALDVLGIRIGASHAEIKVNSCNELKIIEIGARMGGGMIGSDLVHLSTGYDFVKGVIDCAIGDFEEPVITQNKHSGIYFLSADTAQVKEYIDNRHLYPEIVKTEITDSVLHELHDDSDRSGYFIYQSDIRLKI